MKFNGDNQRHAVEPGCVPSPFVVFPAGPFVHNSPQTWIATFMVRRVE
jgi:hypothetical protein